MPSLPCAMTGGFTTSAATSSLHAYINSIVASHFLHFSHIFTNRTTLFLLMEEEIARATAESTTEALAGKLHELLADSDIDASQFSFEEETIEEVMQEFYKEIIACPITPMLPKEEEEEEISPVVELHHDAAEAGEFEKIGVVEEYTMEEFEDEVDFDDEWLAKVLNWSQGKVGDTNHWF